MRMKSLVRRAAALLSAVLLTVSLSGGAFAYGHTGSSDALSAFDVSLSGGTLQLDMEGSTWWAEVPVRLTYADGSVDVAKLTISNSDVSFYINGPEDWRWSNVAVGTLSRSGEPYTASIRIPTSALHSDVFDLTLSGVTVTAAELGHADAGLADGRAEDTSSSDEPEEGSAGQEENEQAEETGEPDAPQEEDIPQEPDIPEEAEQSAEGPDSHVSLTPNASGRITVDGELSDWAGVAAMSHPSSQIGEWKLARDKAGNVYIAYSGEAVSEWDFTYTGKMLVIMQNGKTSAFQVSQAGSATWYLKETGEYAVVNTANHNTSAPYGVEAMIPASNFDGEFMIGLGDSEDSAIMISSGEIPVLDGQEYRGSRDEDREAVYNGIVIDGKFGDWDAVSRQNVSDLDPNGTLQEAAMVFDGDMVYIYLRETQHTSAGGAGSHSNAKFTLLTDLGYQTMFELHWDSAQVSGVEGAKSSHVGDQWEIAIPKSNLPNYNNTINLGLYQGSILVPAVSNLDGSSGSGQGGETGSFDGIRYDGHYSDWDFYPHHLIQYATAGTQKSMPDGEGALYFSGEDSRIYGHVHTEMPEHLSERGGEYGYAVTFRFNDDEAKKLGITLAGVDAAGNIDWSGANAVLGQLEEGQTVEFGIFDLQTWHSSPNINSLSVDSDRMYGKMYITRTAGKEECEFYLDVDALAAKYGMSEKEFREVAAQFGRIGQEWIVTSGASSGPWLGVGLSCAAVGGVWFIGKKKEEAGAQ